MSLSRSRVAVHEEGDEDDPRDGEQDDDGSTARPASGHLNPGGKATSDLKHLNTLGLVFFRQGSTKTLFLLGGGRHGLRPF